MILDKFSLTGRVAVVTGSSRGIGQAIAQALAEAGADIIGVSAGGDFTETEAIVRHAGRKFSGYKSNFEDRESVYSFIHNVKADFPRVDILVNNAGTIMRKPAAEHPDEYWDKVININLNSLVYTGQRVWQGYGFQGVWQNSFYSIIAGISGWCICAGLCSVKRRDKAVNHGTG